MERMGLSTVIIPLVFLTLLFRLSSFEYVGNGCTRNKSPEGIEYRCYRKNIYIKGNLVSLQCTNHYGTILTTEIPTKLDLSEFNHYETILTSEKPTRLDKSEYNDYGTADEIPNRLYLSEFNDYGTILTTETPTRLDISEYYDYGTADEKPNRLYRSEFNDYGTILTTETPTRLDISEYNDYGAADAYRFYRSAFNDYGTILTTETPTRLDRSEFNDYGTILANEIPTKLDLSEFIFFELRNCLFKVSLYEILSRLNMKKVKYFTLSFRALKSNYNPIINVTKEIFEHVESMEYLRLEGDRLNLSVDFLENTPKLRELSLRNNGLTQISKYFNHVPNLETLDLSMNQIAFIPDGAFEDLEKLVELQVSNNNLTSITKNTFKGLKSLQILLLNSNHIENIEEESFADMDKLVTISLQFNNIQEPHRHLFKNNKLLKHIKLEYNPNLVLPDYLFENLTSLQTIDLSFNKLQEIPEHIFSNCGKLRDLTLEENSLSTIPEKTFRNLTSLKKLDISSNLLVTLSYQLLSPLNNLEELYVRNNQLTGLDFDIFHKMGKLKILNLSWNKIGLIPRLALRGSQLFSLIHPDLSHNQWNNTNDITPFTIQCSSTIRDYGNIQQIFPLLKLKKIDLSFNLIKDLRVFDFMSTSYLNLEVNLTHNEIQYVDFQLEKVLDLFGDTSHYNGPSNIIHLDNNPILCDCSNIDLIHYNNDEMEFIKSVVDIKQDKLTCSDNKNMFVTDLEPNQISCPIEGCPSPCTCTYQYNNGTVVVDCSFKNLTSYPECSFNEPKYKQTILNLRGNHLNAGPVENSNYTNVTYLDLSRNHIKEMTWIPPNIKELHLEGNQLRRLDNHFVNLLKNRTSLVRISLENNSWDCNCEASDLQRFLLQYGHKVNPSNVYCHNSTTQLMNISILCKTTASPSLLIVLLPIVLTILLCFTVALALYYRYQKEIKIYLYAQNLCLWFVTEEELDKDKTYDVFISYAHQDEKFVVEYLLPELEHGQTPFKVCVHMRDWVPGELIATQVINSVKESRRTLVVLSNNFVDSMWGKMEFRTAHTEAITEGRARVIVVIYGDLNEDKLDDELKCYIKTNTYVKWGDKYFWNKLKYALPHSRQQVKMVVQTDKEFDLITTPPSPKNTSTSLVTSDVSL